MAEPRVPDPILSRVRCQRAPRVVAAVAAADLHRKARSHRVREIMFKLVVS